jgi:hypothetical protein
MESGNREELRDAMNDVATTVEYLLDNDMLWCYNISSFRVNLVPLCG